MSSDANAATTMVPLDAAALELRGNMARLLRSSAIYGATSFAVKTFNFLLIALYSRFLLPADYGIVALSEVSAMIVSTIAGLGLLSAVVRFYFEHADDRERQRRCMGTLLRLSLVMTAAGLALVVIAGLLAPDFFADQVKVAFFPYLALAVTTAAVTQMVDFRSALYQAEQAPRQFARLSLFSFFLANLGVITFVVVYRKGAAGLLLGKCLGATGTSMIALWLLRSWWSAGWEREDFRAALRYGFPLVPHQVLALGLVAADRFILSRYRDMNEVGIYSLAYTLGMVMYMFTAAVSPAWSPMFYDLARKGDSGRRAIGKLAQHMIALLTLVACFGILIAQPFTSWFLDARYAPAGRLVPIIISSYLFHALTSLLQTPLLQAKRTSALAVVTAAAFALNIGLNLAWIPRWGMYGAAYATLAAYALQTAMMYGLAQSAFRLSYGGLKLISWMALLVSMLFISQSAIASQANLMVPIRLVIAAGMVFAAQHLWGAELRSLLGVREAEA